LVSIAFLSTLYSQALFWANVKLAEKISNTTAANAFMVVLLTPLLHSTTRQRVNLSPQFRAQNTNPYNKMHPIPHLQKAGVLAQNDPMPPKYAVTRSRLMAREKELLRELEDVRTSIAACLQAMECPASLIKEFKEERRITSDRSASARTLRLRDARLGSHDPEDPDRKPN
jgi:hypothetical protein